jgi:catechol 2,3-dioxygenase-like lactoylglutathione lyase family enzyme
MRLNHVTPIVTNVERSTAFYKRLGLVPVVHEPPRYARFRCPDSDETVSIEVTGEPPAPEADRNAKRGSDVRHPAVMATPREIPGW